MTANEFNAWYADQGAQFLSSSVIPTRGQTHQDAVQAQINTGVIRASGATAVGVKTATVNVVTQANQKANQLKNHK